MKNKLKNRVILQRSMKSYLSIIVKKIGNWESRFGKESKL
jgi:hypothetical protein